MTSGYDRAAAARYWGEERLAAADELAAVLSLREPAVVNRAYDLWERTLVARTLAPLAGRQVLDLGCGVGRMSAFLASLGARMVAVDNAAGMLARCRARLGGTPAALAQGEASRLPIADASLDAGVCVGLLEHLPAGVRRAALGELARVVRPGGRLALVANNSESELLRRPDDNPHRRGTQFENGYFCEVVGSAEVVATLAALGWTARVAGANPFYSLLRFRRHAEPALDLDDETLAAACRAVVDLDLAGAGTTEADRRWADHLFIVAERA